MKKILGYIDYQDVGRMFTKDDNGNLHWVKNTLVIIHLEDVGKAIYLEDGVFKIETKAEKRERLKHGSNGNEETASLKNS